MSGSTSPGLVVRIAARAPARPTTSLRYLRRTQDYRQELGIWGSPWVGIKQFQLLFNDELFMRSLWNTISIAFLKLVFAFPASIVLALFLNEVRVLIFKRVVQTVVYAPYFLSWVIYAAIL